MSLIPLTERQQTLIVNNVVSAVKDINKLNRTGYKYLYLCSGFIAHYNHYGFISHYQDYDLMKDILDNFNANKWLNFRPGDKHYEYYRSKADVYAQIVSKIA